MTDHSVDFSDDGGVSLRIELSAETVDKIIAGGNYFAVIRDDGSQTTVRCREEHREDDDLREDSAGSDLRSALGIAIDLWIEEQKLAELDRLRDCLKEMLDYISLRIEEATRG